MNKRKFILIIAMLLIAACLFVACNPDNGDDGDGDQFAVQNAIINDSAYTYSAPQPTALTAEQAKALLLPYVKEVYTASDMSWSQGEEDMIFGEYFEQIIQSCAKSGLSYDALEEYMRVIDGDTEAWDYIIKVLKGFIVDFEYSDDNYIDNVFAMFPSALINDWADSFGTVISKLDANLLIAVIDNIFVSNDVFGLNSIGLRLRDEYVYMSFSEYNAFVDASGLSFNSYVQEESWWFDLVKSNSGVYLASHLIDGLATFKNVDGDKVVEILNLVKKMVKDGFENVLKDTSIKQIIGLVNYVGGFFGDMLDAMGDLKVMDVALHNILDPLFLALGMNYDVPTYGMLQAARFVCQKLENLTSEDVLKIYENFDDYSKEADDTKKTKKLGCFVVNLAEFLIKDGLLSEDILNFACEVVGSIGLNGDAVKELFITATAKPADQFTDAELEAIAELVDDVTSNDAEEFYVYDSFIDKSATATEIKEWVKANTNVYDFVYYDGDTTAFNYDNYTYELKQLDENRGQILMSSATESYVCDVYLVDMTKTGRYCVGLRGNYSGEIERVFTLNANAPTIAVSDLYAYFYDTETNFSSRDVTIKSVTVKNFNSSTVGRKVATIELDCGELGIYQCPYIYEVVDDNNPVVTGICVRGNNAIAKGSTIDALGIIVLKCYNYQDPTSFQDYQTGEYTWKYEINGEYVDADADDYITNYTVTGFDSTTVGWHYISLSYGDYEYNISYNVVDLESASTLELYAPSYNSTWNEEYECYEMYDWYVNFDLLDVNQDEIFYSASLSSIQQKVANISNNQFEFVYEESVDSDTNVTTVTAQLKKDGEVIKTFEPVKYILMSY